MSPRRHGGFRFRSTGLAALMAGLLASASSTLAAGAPSSAWDMVLDGGSRQCRLTLRGDSNGKGASVAMPPGCHRAFPALNGVVLWSDQGEGKLQLNDARGEPVLIFAAEGNGYATTSPQGESFHLRPADPASRANLAKAVAAAQAQADAAQAIEKPAIVAKPAALAVQKAAVSNLKPDEVAGRYAVLRDKTHDTGCMVTLDDKSRGPSNTLKARLAPACRDQGIVIFDPVGWQMIAGQIVLTARKGHSTELGIQQDGSWMNSPKTGKSLSLKKI